MFIRLSTFFLVITFIFTINCLLLTSSDIHNRYIYAIEHKKIKQVKYAFGHEFLKIFLCALISNIFKILCIKFLYGNYFFKISHITKEDLSSNNQVDINKKEFEELNKRREEFIKSYIKKSIIFVSIVIIFLLLFGYISSCYVGIFPNTFSGLITRYFISLILSIIICAFICFIIVIIYQIGKSFDLVCFIKCYNFIQKIY